MTLCPGDWLSEPHKQLLEETTGEMRKCRACTIEGKYRPRWEHILKDVLKNKYGTAVWIIGHCWCYALKISHRLHRGKIKYVII